MFRLPSFFERLRNDREQRDFISSGTAAGLTAAFGTPIGGVLFSLEETSSFWSRELTWRTFFGCMVSAFTVNAIFSFSGSQPLSHVVNDYGLLSFGLSRYYLYRYEELAAFAVLGLIGGLLGALFVRLNIKLNIWRQEHLRNSKLKSLLEVFLVVSICAVLTFTLPIFGKCHSLSDAKTSPNICDNTPFNATSPSSIYCAEGEYNDFANLFLVPQDRALKGLFSRTGKMFSFEALSLFLIVYFSMTLVTAGLSVAAGLFVPMMLVGATFGRIIGRALAEIFSSLDPPIDPSIYALVGCSAMMSGFSRSTISLVVIITELTENTQFLLPIMLAVMIAKFVGDLFSRSIYEEWMEMKAIPFLGHRPPPLTDSMCVTDAMQSNVLCFNETENLERIIEILETTNHNGFPVVKNYGEDREHTFRGMILRKQILILLDRQLYQEKDLLRKGPSVLDFELYCRLMNSKWKLDEKKLPLAENRKRYILDIGPYMDRSHPFVQKNSSFLDAYHFFHLLGLRHLPVVDELFQVVGIITRHDLLQFHSFNFHSNSSQSGEDEI